MIYVLQYGINFDSDIKENETKEKMQKLFKPDVNFEARVKNIDFNNYKSDLMIKPSEMESHKSYIRLMN